MIRAGLRWLLSAVYALAGIMHLAAPAPFIRITPHWVPMPSQVVALTGVAELVGAMALVQPWSRRLRWLGGMGLALYALCVWPANFAHAQIDLLDPENGLGIAYHGPRLLFQPVIVWLALWTGEVTRWPLARPAVD